MSSRFHRPDREEMDGQKLKRITASDRKLITLAVSANRRNRKWQEAKENAQHGPHTCVHCHAEPCGSMWPQGACCHRCTHLPMPHWKLTHVLWYRKKPFYVMEVMARRPGAPTPEELKELRADRQRGEIDEEQRWGVQRTEKVGSISDAVYYRWDGVSHWIRRARTHYFLGVRASPAEFMRCLPTAEELVEFAPRERAPNPFEEGITERPADEVGDPIGDRIEQPPPEKPTGEKFYKHGLAFVELAEAEEQEARDDAALLAEGKQP
jgi:hypothetical protein